MGLLGVNGYQGSSSYLLEQGAAALAPAARALRTDRELVPGEVVVRFRPSVAPLAAGGASLAARAAALGLVPRLGDPERMPVLLGLGAGEAGRARAFAALDIPAAPGRAALDPVEAARRDTLDVVKALRARPEVASADPNFVVHALRTPEDPLYPEQWSLPLLNLPAAWDDTTGEPPASEIVVAVVDSGVVLAHPDLAGQLVQGWDFLGGGAQDGDDADPDDPGDGLPGRQSTFHGTAVAGVVAARSSGAGASGVAGVAWGAKVMPLRALGPSGGTTYGMVQALRYAAGLPNSSSTFPPRRAGLANLSIGCSGCFSTSDEAAFQELRSAGLVLVAAAGNDGGNALVYPASYPGVLSVAAVENDLAHARYSNANAAVDVAAPGGHAGGSPESGVLTTTADDSGGTRVPTWGAYAGTSLASPHVAGVVALMLSVCPSLAPSDLDALVASGAVTRDLGPPGRDDHFGHGLVDAAAAVQAARARCGEVPPVLDATPQRLDLGPFTSAGTVRLSVLGGGGGALAITATADASWVSVAPPAAPDGAWTVTVDRGALASGEHRAELRFVGTAGGMPVSLEMPITAWVGLPLVRDRYTRTVRVLLLDSDLRVVRRASPFVPGVFAFESLAPGRYHVVAGTDLDADGWICDPGDVCGAWPSVGALAPIEVDGVHRDVNLTLEPVLRGGSLPGQERGLTLGLAGQDALAPAPSP